MNLPSFLVIVPDTFRADRIGARTPTGAPVTPNIDALAARGVTFTQAYSQSGWTMPALASLLSGRFPLAPEAADGHPLDFLRTDLQDLPELLQAAGYHTAAFWSPFIGDGPKEFSRGFDHVAVERGDDFAEGVVAWLREQDQRPFFALVHNSDLQFPVVAVPENPLLAHPGPMTAQGLEPTFQTWVASGGFEASRMAAPVAYNAVVTRYDAAIGEMVHALDDAGLRDDTTIVVTSNHGIELGEHGHYKHGNLYDYDIHVPLVIVDPKMPAPGTRISTVVQVMDIAPTLLDRAGRRAGEEVTGQSFLSLLGLGGLPYAARDVFSICSRTTMSLRTPTLKLSRSAPKDAPDGTSVSVGFDLRSDPQEMRPVQQPFHEPIAALVPRLDAWWAERKAETDSARPSGASPEAMKKFLQDNGYWGVASGTAAGK